MTVAQTESSVLVATIDLTNALAVATVGYAVPQYVDGSTHVIKIRTPPPCITTPVQPIPGFMPEFGTGPCLHLEHAPNKGGQIAATNIANLNLVFAIPQWPDWTFAPGQPSGITFQVGPQSQTVPRGTLQVEFKNVVGTTVPLALTVHGGIISAGTPVPVGIPGILPLKIER